MVIRQIKCFSILVFLIFLVAGCSAPVEQNNFIRSSNRYARGFKIERFENYNKLIILNPWEKAENIAFEYALVSKKNNVPDSLALMKVIRTPVRRVICLSTTHLAFLDALNENNSIVGISGEKYIYNSLIRDRYEKGLLFDVGYGQNLNYELIISQNPDLVMVYGIGSEITGYVNKLEELGVPVIIAAEYLEQSPLGKAEWIKFIGALFEKEIMAEQIFAGIEKEYLKLKNMVSDVTRKPMVMVGSLYKDQWWVPGGNSYMANLISDAGGEYIGRGNNSNESYVISFENALVWADKADIWINMANMASRKDILASDERFASFGVFREGKIFNNIKRLSIQGGNDFWESGTVNPHKILRDLIIAFHPGVMNAEMTYYTEIR
jgi:iron complex transport system substrate-binding protein